jgi:transcriptional regulator GlxA family with amidase domain
MTQNLPMARRRMILVVFPGVQTLDAAGPAEVFAAAGYEVVMASGAGGPVATTAGFAISTTCMSRLRPRTADTVLCAGGGEAAIRGAVADRRLSRWLLRAAPVVERLGSVCSGAFLLATLGLLDGRRAATHWSACERLARLRPAIDVDAEAIFVHDGKLWTSAGVTTGIDMALAMVEADRGRAVVDELAARLVLYARRPGFQSQWSAALVAQARGSAPLADVIAWSRARLDRPLGVDALAKAAGLSPRTFHRRCREHLGVTPARLVARLRVERARTLLATSRLSAKEIAALCGLRDGAQLARLVRRDLGVTPREYRARFAAA